MPQLRVVLPKGHLFDNVHQLLKEAGVHLDVDERGYRPVASDPEIAVKIMKPQDIPALLELGSHDVGFTGRDWIAETGADVQEVMNLGFDPVRLVAAIPKEVDEAALRDQQVVVASEYEHIPRRYLDEEGFEYVFLRTNGATEVFPPDDADMVVDNTATGRTLTEHDLKVIATLMESSTRFVAHRASLEDDGKRKKIRRLETLFRAILDARGRVMLEMNVPSEKLEALIDVLPSMRAPTVAALHHEQGYAVKTAIPRAEAVRLIPRLKHMGATDILEYNISKVIA